MCANVDDRHQQISVSTDWCSWNLTFGWENVTLKHIIIKNLTVSPPYSRPGGHVVFHHWKTAQRAEEREH